MALIAVLMLIAIPVSFAYAVLCVVRLFMIRQAAQGYVSGFRGARLSLDDLKYRIIIPLTVMVLCFGVLFFTNKFYSLSMTFQMPEECRYLSDHKTLQELDGPVIGRTVYFKGSDSSSQNAPLNGTKAVTVQKNFGAYSNTAMQTVGVIFDLPNELLFKFSGEYIPKEYRAKDFEDVGYLVVVKHSATLRNEYTSGAKAYSHDVEVFICDDKTVLAAATFTGTIKGSTTLKSGDVIGDVPSEAISQWVAAELDRLTKASTE
jgi:hypothetical protein